MFSNDFIFHVAKNEEAAVALKKKIDDFHVDRQAVLSRAIRRGRVESIKRALDRGARVNRRSGRGGSTPLSDASLRGKLDVVKFLVQRGANVKGTNRDGNTPLHVAAFMCREDVVKFLLEKGASVETKNQRGETPIDVVRSEWSEGLGNFYSGIGQSSGFEVDLERMQKTRPLMVKLLEKHAKKKR